MTTKPAPGALTQTSQSHTDEEILSGDIIIPYLLLISDLSDMKKSGKAQPGDIRKSSTAEKYGDLKKPVELIFLHYPKNNWILEQRPARATRFEYRAMFKREANNENLSWEFWGDDNGNEVAAGTPGATMWKRVKQLAVFALIKEDIEAFAAEKIKVAAGQLPDPSKSLTPVLVSFRGSRYDAGKEVGSFFTQCKSFGTHISRYSLPMQPILVKDENEYYSLEIDRNKSTPVPPEMLADVNMWVDMLSNKKINLKTEAVDTETGAQPIREVRNYAPSS